MYPNSLHWAFKSLFSRQFLSISFYWAFKVYPQSAFIIFILLFINCFYSLLPLICHTLPSFSTNILFCVQHHLHLINSPITSSIFILSNFTVYPLFPFFTFSNISLPSFLHSFSTISFFLHRLLRPLSCLLSPHHSRICSSLITFASLSFERSLVSFI